MDKQNLIIYKTEDGKASVALHARDGNVWLNQSQLAELFSTSKQNVSSHMLNILEEKEMDENSVVKDFLTTASDGKDYNVRYYALPMILAIGFRVRSIRGTQFHPGNHGTGAERGCKKHAGLCRDSEHRQGNLQWRLFGQGLGSIRR